MKTVLSMLICVSTATITWGQDQPGSVIDSDLSRQNKGISAAFPDATTIPTTSIFDDCGGQVINYHALPPCTCPLPNSGQIVTGSGFNVSPMHRHGSLQIVPMPQPTVLQNVVTDTVQPVQPPRPQYYYSPQRPFRRGFRLNRFRR